MQGFVIVISGVDAESDTLYWNGTDTTGSPNAAQFYSSRADAKYDAKDLLTRYIDSDVTVSPATKTIAVGR